MPRGAVEDDQEFDNPIQAEYADTDEALGKAFTPKQRRRHSKLLVPDRLRSPLNRYEEVDILVETEPVNHIHTNKDIATE
ncbi:hypothetical protein PENANT_c036G11619 [Penicillium antarcticum]|uniref:Uncharacterized protein n=1 Tax=Penicillium antarcticum TaxID=416450 RepID=A0A1V6PTP3_9EURO|nr:hypothetical protein PENANT_c036G11619 [Penicillium antarcticum]